MKSFAAFLLAMPAVLALPAVIERNATIESVPNSWIVQLEDDAVLDNVLGNARSVAGVEPTSTFSIGGFRGFSFNGDEAAVDQLRTLGALKRIEPDYIVEATVPTGQLQDRALVTQSSATWGLSRLSSRSRGTSGYVYDNTAGQGTFVYVIDTGVNSAHSDFGGRAVQGATFITGESIADGNGHGTHCSGTIAGATYGVAKRATVIGVKTLSAAGRGTSSSTLQGLDWALTDARRRGINRSVFSMSLGGPFSQISNNAVAEAVRAGVFVAVAAGNNNLNAAGYSPASEPTACTVGATDINDNRSTFSNFGSLVDIFAPGTNVLSTWIGGTTATRSISGTSMACPHVAGLAAYLIALEGTRTPAALCQRIQALSIRNAIANVGSGSPNYLAYNGNGR